MDLVLDFGHREDGRNSERRNRQHRALFAAIPQGDSRIVRKDDARRTGLPYGHLVERVRFLIRNYGFDALIVLGAVASALIVWFSGDADNAPTSPLWFAVPAVAVVVLPLLCRRRFPFAAPAAFG